MATKAQSGRERGTNYRAITLGIVDKIHLPSTRYTNTCVMISTVTGLPILAQRATHSLRKYTLIAQTRNAKGLSQIRYNMLHKGHFLWLKHAVQGKKRLSQNFLYSKSMQLQQMMKQRPCDYIPSSPACTMKEHEKSLNSLLGKARRDNPIPPLF